MWIKPWDLLQSFLLDLYINIVNGDIINANKVLNNIYKNGAAPKQIIDDLLNVTYSEFLL